MNNTKILCAVVGLLIAIATRAAAQENKAFDPLSPSTGQMLMCRSIAVTPADSADRIFEFREGSDPLSRRETLVAYDSVGSALYLLLSAADTLAGWDSPLHYIAIRFQPKGEGTHARIALDLALRTSRVQPGDSAQRLPPGVREVSSEEITRARALAQDFWSRRCGRSGDSIDERLTLSKRLISKR